MRILITTLLALVSLLAVMRAGEPPGPNAENFETYGVNKRNSLTKRLVLVTEANIN